MYASNKTNSLTLTIIIIYAELTILSNNVSKDGIKLQTVYLEIKINYNVSNYVSKNRNKLECEIAHKPIQRLSKVRSKSSTLCFQSMASLSLGAERKLPSLILLNFMKCCKAIFLLITTQKHLAHKAQTMRP